MKKVKLPKGFRELKLENEKTLSLLDVEKFLKYIFIHRSNTEGSILFSISRYCKHKNKWITVKGGELEHECDECVNDMFKTYLKKDIGFTNKPDEKYFQAYDSKKAFDKFKNEN